MIEKKKREYCKEYYKKNRDKILARHRKYSSEHREEILKGKKVYYVKHREGLCLSAKRYYAENREEKLRYAREYQASHVEEVREKQSAWHLGLRIAVLSHYGKGKLECVRCGFGDIRALSIDHINGGGSNHMAKVGRNHSYLYLWLRREGYPEGYQTLCHNCQWIKRVENKEYGGKLVSA